MTSLEQGTDPPNKALHLTGAAWQDEAALAGERQRWADKKNCCNDENPGFRLVPHAVEPRARGCSDGDH